MSYENSFNRDRTPKWLRRHASPLPLFIGIIALLFLLSLTACSTPSARPDLPPPNLLVKCPERPELPETDMSVPDFLSLVPEREAMWAACIRRQHRLVNWVLSND